MVGNSSDTEEEKFSEGVYISRVNRVLDHIEKNLDSPLLLEDLAKVACISSWHLHRMFTALVGESLRQYIIRLRLERSAHLLRRNPAMSITEIALDLGFANSAAFSKAFKGRFNCSPRDWRKGQSPLKAQGTRRPSLKQGFSQVVFSDTERNRYLGTRLEFFQPQKAAYVRYIGPYAGEDQLFKSLYQRLISRMMERGLEVREPMKGLVLYHDDPSITEEEKLRVTVCMTLEDQQHRLEEFPQDSDMGILELAGGWYSCSSFKTHREGFLQAWDWVYNTWIPQSGWELDNRPCFEWGQGSPSRGEDPVFEYDICISIQKPGN